MIVSILIMSSNIHREAFTEKRFDGASSDRVSSDG